MQTHNSILHASSSSKFDLFAAKNKNKPTPKKNSVSTEHVLPEQSFAIFLYCQQSIQTI